MSVLLARPDHATGIIASNALTVPGIYQGVRAAALRIPADISVMAIAERCALAGMEPSVTVMAHAVAEIAHQGIQLMVTRIAQPALPARTVLIRAPLEVGESTALAPRAYNVRGPRPRGSIRLLREARLDANGHARDLDSTRFREPPATRNYARTRVLITSPSRGTYNCDPG